MKSERGLSLVEVLGAITILGFIAVIISHVLINSMASSKSISIKQEMQQEADNITEKIRDIYLADGVDKIVLESRKDELLINEEQVISQGYTYEIATEVIELGEPPVILDLMLKKDGHEHRIYTKFSMPDWMGEGNQ